MLGKAFKFQLKKENQDVKSGGKGSGKEGKKAEGKKDSKKQASKEEEKTKSKAAQSKDAQTKKVQQQQQQQKQQQQQAQQQQQGQPQQNINLPVTVDTVPPAVPPHRNILQDLGGGGGDGGGGGGGGGEDARAAELVKKVESLEAELKRKEDRVAQLAAERDGQARELAELRADGEKLRSANEKMVTEKWELSAANNELKNRLQQSMALSYMQDGTDTMLQEELHKMQVALAEERKVTEKLSRNLELEKRRVESMEQKLKSSFRKSGGGGGGSAVAAVQHLPEEVKTRDDQLASSMERYRLHCEGLSASLEECEGKLASFEIQEDYHVADLRKELAAVKKMLVEERKRSEFDTERFQEVQTMFGQVFKDYATTIDGLKQVQQKKKLETQQQRVYDEIRENSYHEMTDSLTAKVLQAEEQLREERVRSKMLEDKLRQMEVDVEAIPILKAQVEVYQSDFNQERAAREKIAGEKADLEEELRKIKTAKQQTHFNQDINMGTEPLPPIGISGVRDRVNHIDDAPNRMNNSAFDDY